MFVSIKGNSIERFDTKAHCCFDRNCFNRRVSKVFKSEDTKFIYEVHCSGWIKERRRGWTRNF